MIDLKKNTDRIHLSMDADLNPKTVPLKKVSDGYGGKPKGLWYSFGDLWLEKNQEDKIKDYSHCYRLEVDLDSVLMISKPEMLNTFIKQFQRPAGEAGQAQFEPWAVTGLIDWNRVAKHYSGIEFPELFGTGALWYKGLFVPSGCIWDVSVIRSIRAISNWTES